MKKIIILIAALVAATAFAQSSPGLVYGAVPTAGQWNSYFAGKFDYNVNGLPVTSGGTGSTTPAGALRNLIGTPASAGYFVRGNGSSWVASQIQTSDLPPGGALAGGTLGAVPYQSAPSTTSFLSGNTTTVPKFLTSTGTGVAAQAPTFTGSTGTGSVVLSASPTISSPTIGTATITTSAISGGTLSGAAITTSTYNGNTITSGTGTLTLGTKTLAATNSITLAGADGTTMTFPSTSASIARTDNSNTFSGTQTFSGTVAGTALSTYLASPPAIGGTVAAAGSFTTLSASSTVSGTGFVAMQASPNPIGSTAPNTGAFTTLAASSTVSGTGFSTYLASPPAIGGTAANTVKGTTVTASTQLNLTNMLASATAPTVSSCGAGASVTANNGPAAFRFTFTGGGPSACTIGLPAAANGWNCFAQNTTTVANAWIIRQTATSTTSVTLTNYSATTITGWNNNDVIATSCFAY